MFRHYIMTHFNVGLYERETMLRSRLRRSKNFLADEWMEHRIRLFKMFTLPSIMAQSCQDFTWLMFMDINTPAKYREELEAIEYPNLQYHYVDGPPLKNEPVAEVAKNCIPESEGHIITTRIDNDDAFHEDFIGLIQSSYDGSTPKAVIAPHGYILDLRKKRLRAMTYRGNNCPSLIEDRKNMQTVRCCSHAYVERRGKGNVAVLQKPLWLQVVHGNNAKNRIPSGQGQKKLDPTKLLPFSVLKNFNLKEKELCLS